MKSIKICLSGGGTGGSATPLIALRQHLLTEEITFKQADFFWVGSYQGVEKILAKEQGITYHAIASGKWRRYISWRNLADLALIILAFGQSLILLWRQKPDIIISAGSFISVPLVWAGRIIGIPSLIYQLDAKPGLANKLMAPAAVSIAVAFEKSLADYGRKAMLAGMIVRQEISSAAKLDKAMAKKSFGFTGNKPVLLVVGGSGGASAINKAIIAAKNELTKTFDIIHQTGSGKERTTEDESYKPYDFIETKELAAAYAAADIVLSRAGLGFLSELAQLKKPAIIIPLPQSHQEDNASYLAEKQAIAVLEESLLSPDKLIETALGLLQPQKAALLGENLHLAIKTSGERKLTEMIKKIIG
jgi:UDP-N-acetylglucosamine--N-acetylmuramyl-(pentapeptide) pyrophosphoryl-undecaprenol N-acetylglucosamine transferase